MNLRRAVLGGLTALSLFPATTLAQAPETAPTGALCAPREGVIKRLKQVYGESPVSRAIVTEVGPVVLFLNPGKGSFTLVTEQGSNLCSVLSGTNWKDLRGVAV